jgi:hypothetical protein
MSKGLFLTFRSILPTTRAVFLCRPCDERCSVPLAVIALCSMLFFTAGLHKTFAAEPRGLSDGVSSSIAINTSGDWLKRQQISNGYLVSLSAAATTSGVTLSSLATGADKIVSVNPGGSPAILSGAAVLGPNRLVISGIQTSASSGDEAWAGVSAMSFVAFSDFAGNVTSQIELGSFGANQACVASDGNVWVLGQDMVKEASFWRNGNDGSKVPAADDYDMLRVYSASGNLLRSLIKRSSVQSNSEFFLHLGASQNNALVCGASSVGVYLAPVSASVSFQPTWYEVNLDDNSVKQWAVYGVPAASSVSGLALPYANTVYGSFSSHESSGYVSGIYTLTLGTNGNATWSATLVAPQSATSATPRLKVLGSSNGTLLYVNGSTISGQSPVVTSVQVSAAATPTKEVAPTMISPYAVVTSTEAGNVQIQVNGADYLLKGLGYYASNCYSTAVINAKAALQATVTAWKTTSVANRRSASYDITTKKNITSQEATLNSALKAETSKTRCTRIGKSMGPLGDVDAPTFAMQDERAPRLIQATYLFEDQGLRFLKVSLDSCRHTCDSKYAAALALCGLLVVQNPTPLGVGAAAACVVYEMVINIGCYDSCPADAGYCPTQSNYYALNTRNPRRRGRQSGYAGAPV